MGFSLLLGCPWVLVCVSGSATLRRWNLQRGRSRSYQGPGVERFLDGEGGGHDGGGGVGNCSGGDDLCNYDDGSARLTDGRGSGAHGDGNGGGGNRGTGGGGGRGSRMKGWW